MDNNFIIYPKGVTLWNAVILSINLCVTGINGQSCVTLPHTNTTCVKFITTPATFEDAKISCHNDSSTLISVTDAATQTAVSNWLLANSNGNTNSKWWIGGKEENRGMFVWADNGLLGTYMDWANGGPNTQTFRCIYMTAVSFTWKWSDQNCAQSDLWYICQKKNKVAANCNLANTNLHQSFYGQTSTCYTIHKTKVSWFDAFQNCNSDGEMLITIESKGVHDHIKAVLLSIQQEVVNAVVNGIWIGLHSNKWVWTDGSEITSFFWINNEPVSVDGCISEKYYSFTESSPPETYYGWSYEPCTTPLNYICVQPIMLTTDNPTTDSSEPTTSTSEMVATTTDTTTTTMQETTTVPDTTIFADTTTTTSVHMTTIPDTTTTTVPERTTTVLDTTTLIDTTTSTAIETTTFIDTTATALGTTTFMDSKRKTPYMDATTVKDTTTFLPTTTTTNLDKTTVTDSTATTTMETTIAVKDTTTLHDITARQTTTTTTGFDSTVAQVEITTGKAGTTTTTPSSTLSVSTTQTNNGTTPIAKQQTSNPFPAYAIAIIVVCAALMILTVILCAVCLTRSAKEKSVTLDTSQLMQTSPRFSEFSQKDETSNSQTLENMSIGRASQGLTPRERNQNGGVLVKGRLNPVSGEHWKWSPTPLERTISGKYRQPALPSLFVEKSLDDDADIIDCEIEYNNEETKSKRKSVEKTVEDFEKNSISTFDVHTPKTVDTGTNHANYIIEEKQLYLSNQYLDTETQKPNSCNVEEIDPMYDTVLNQTKSEDDSNNYADTIQKSDLNSESSKEQHYEEGVTPFNTIDMPLYSTVNKARKYVSQIGSEGADSKIYDLGLEKKPNTVIDESKFKTSIILK